MALNRLPYKILLMLLPLITACSNDKEELGDYGWFLNYVHRASEQIFVNENVYSSDDVSSEWADILVRVTDSQESGKVTQTTDPYIEQQIQDFIDPNHEYRGDMPIVVEYRTEECKSIRIGLYDKADKLLSDLTNQARFSYVYSQYDMKEVGANLLISSDRVLIGRIQDEMTIKEYLSYHPMVFAEAHFFLQGLKRTELEDGNYVKVEVVLGNGKKLEATSSVD